MKKFPKSLLEFQQMFPDDRACAAYLFEQRWPEGFVCPACGSVRAWELRSKPFTWECADCGRQTSVTAGMVMHGSKLPLTTWFWAAYLMASHSNGISALQLMKQLGLGSYRTAWMLCHKLRRAMVDPDRSQLSGWVEVDETLIPYRTKKDSIAGSRGRSHDGRMAIIAAVELTSYMVGRLQWKITPGRIRLAAIPDFTRETFHNFLYSTVAQTSTIYTDGHKSYEGLSGFIHQPTVVGKMAAHVNLEWVHRIFALLKRWALGVYHGLRRRHIQRYLEEFTFRFNRRLSRPATFHLLLGIARRIPPVTYRGIVDSGSDTIPKLPPTPPHPPFRGKLSLTGSTS